MRQQRLPTAFCTEALYAGILVCLKGRLKACVSNAFGEIFWYSSHGMNVIPAQAWIPRRPRPSPGLPGMTIELYRAFLSHHTSYNTIRKAGIIRRGDFLLLARCAATSYNLSCFP